MSRFGRQLDGPGLAIALEITPPRQPSRGVLLRRAGGLGLRAHAVNVIQRPDRVASLEAALELQESGIEPVWHLATRGRARTEIELEIEQALEAGLEQVLCVRGDHAGQDGADTPTIREVVARIRRRAPDARIGVTFNPHAPRERATANLVGKLRAGADFVQTQPVFDRDGHRDVVRAIRAAFPLVRIVPMLMPVLDAAGVSAIRKRLGFDLPEDVAARIVRGGPDAGWAVFGETLAALRREQLADGVALMTRSADPAPDVLERLAAFLDSSAAAPAP